MVNDTVNDIELLLNEKRKIVTLIFQNINPVG